jgi:molybdate transport system substrate-binding protein
MRRAILALAILSLQLHACDVPVCRYALLNWEAEPYAATLFHAGPLSAEDQRRLAPLRKAVDDGQLNLSLSLIDTSKPLSDDEQQLWKKHNPAQLPWIVVNSPESAESYDIATGVLTSDFISSLIDSPLRTQITRNVSNGNAVVWLLLESGNEKEDAALAATLASELKKAEDAAAKASLSAAEEAKQELALDSADADPNVPLPVAKTFSFSVLRVSRDNSAEKLTLRSILRNNPALLANKGAMVFPIIGRGRVLDPLQQSALNAETISRAADFLSGPCSCEIKASLSGTDLLLHADWTELATATPDATVVAAEAAPGTSAPKADTKSTLTPAAEIGAAPPSPPSAKARGVSTLATLGLCGLVIAALAMLFAGNAFKINGHGLSPLLKTGVVSVLLVGALGGALYLNQKPAALSSAGPAEPLMVYCAAALKTPVEAIKIAYEKEYGREVRVQFGSSDSLLTQIKLSGKADIYIPADSSYIDSATQANVAAEIIPIAYMTPVIAVAKGNPTNVRNINDLLRDNTRVILANSAAAIGKVTRDMLQSRNRWAEFQQRMQNAGTISECGTVTEVGNSLKIGAADAGIIWDALAGQYPSLEIVRDPLLDTINSNIALTVLKTSTQPSNALHFARYLSANGKGIEEFKSRGYRTVAADDWAETPVIKLFAGAMLRPAIKDTLQQFEARENVNVLVDYNGCGILVGKMKTGDKPDMFVACDATFLSQVQSSFEKGETLSSNDLVIVVKKGNPHGIQKLRDLAEKKIRIGVGHEKQCALGMLTQKRLQDAGLCEAIMKSGNVKVTAPTGDLLVVQLRSGSLDAIIAYASNTTGFDDVETVKVDVAFAQAEQPVAVLKNSQHKHLAERLKVALMAAESKERFLSAGFQWRLKAK